MIKRVNTIRDLREVERKPKICRVVGKTKNLYKKIRDTKGMFHGKIGTKKD